VICNLKLLAMLVALCLLSGCASPSAANNMLRRKNQDLQDQITQLQRQEAADRASILALENKAGAPPMIDQAKIDELFTVHGIRLGKLTGTDPASGQFQVQATPFDESGQKLKAAGLFVIDAFDLADRLHPQLGHWSFDVKQARDAWFGDLFMYCYILKCPWQQIPTHSQITVRLAFTDALTGRQFTDQKVVTITLPTTQPSPATAASAR
jgi:outer membrane murein-binding lipoprotein Lpp